MKTNRPTSVLLRLDPADVDRLERVRAALAGRIARAGLDALTRPPTRHSAAGAVLQAGLVALLEHRLLDLSEDAK
jgi:hypothetical protein